MSKLWYAVMIDDNDDWGYGSYQLNKAKQMVKDLENSQAYIAVIDTDVYDSICIAEIKQDEFDYYGNNYNEIITYKM